MKHLLYILLIIGNLFSSEITDRTLALINDFFPNAISIEHSIYQIPKKQLKAIQNTSKQKFFRKELNLWVTILEDSSRYYSILDNVKGKSLPITFLTTFNEKKEVHQTSIIKYREAYGGEVASKSWLNQFTAFTDTSNYKVGNAISGISGATISVHSVTKGIRKLSILINSIIDNDE
jgi:Na+-translocating ferredoxin:NAD+ oxidoreductase RnfG subunit